MILSKKLQLRATGLLQTTYLRPALSVAPYLEELVELVPALAPRE